MSAAKTGAPGRCRLDFDVDARGTVTNDEVELDLAYVFVNGRPVQLDIDKLTIGDRVYLEEVVRVRARELANEAYLRSKAEADEAEIAELAAEDAREEQLELRASVVERIGSEMANDGRWYVAAGGSHDD